MNALLEKKKEKDNMRIRRRKWRRWKRRELRGRVLVQSHSTLPLLVGDLCSLYSCLGCGTGIRVGPVGVREPFMARPESVRWDCRVRTRREAGHGCALRTSSI